MFTKTPDKHPGRVVCKCLCNRRAQDKFEALQATAGEATFTVDGGSIERVNSFKYGPGSSLCGSSDMQGSFQMAMCS